MRPHLLNKLKKQKYLMQWAKHLLPFGIHYLKSLRAYSGQWNPHGAISIHNSQPLIYPSFSSLFFNPPTRKMNFHTYYSTVVNFFIFFLSIISIQINSTHWLVISSSLLLKVHTDRWSRCSMFRNSHFSHPFSTLEGPTLINAIHVFTYIDHQSPQFTHSSFKGSHWSMKSMQYIQNSHYSLLYFWQGPL